MPPTPAIAHTAFAQAKHADQGPRRGQGGLQPPPPRLVARKRGPTMFTKGPSTPTTTTDPPSQ
eukprot:6549032-Alexandrium_andersonii.AAC.1